MECDVLVERDHAVERCSTEKGYHVPTDREEDKDDIDVQDLGGASCGG